MKSSISILAVVIFCCILLPANAEPGSGSSQEALRMSIVNTAKKYLGIRYNYGGMNEAGFDCSGFVRFVYKRNGIILPRTTAGQFEQGTKIDLAQASAGDLVFFKIDGEKISHVGIVINTREFIHAPSTGKQVTIEKIDTEYWRKRFAGAVTYINKVLQ
ncbi:MAG: hypothetical protein A2W19_00590 [Spirochaetes bacterium RBG_16_49_21]|nr:MAG: hypothetical protein A2W19_00590 [Spirochaetes bacterium RBG_16_49_21]